MKDVCSKLIKTFEEKNLVADFEGSSQKRAHLSQATFIIERVDELVLKCKEKEAILKLNEKERKDYEKWAKLNP